MYLFFVFVFIILFVLKTRFVRSSVVTRMLLYLPGYQICLNNDFDSECAGLTIFGQWLTSRPYTH